MVCKQKIETENNLKRYTNTPSNDKIKKNIFF